MPPRPIRIIPYAVLAARALLSGMTSLAPRPGRPVAAIFPPWWSSARTFAAAARTGGDIVRMGAFTTILVMMPDQSDPPDLNLARHLHDAGALLLLDAQALGACAQNV